MVSCGTNVDVPTAPDVMNAVWRHAASKNFARRRIHDVRLAETLKYWGVDEFHTRNTKNFADLGFRVLSNLLDTLTNRWAAFVGHPHGELIRFINSVGASTPMAYNMSMIFVETSLFTQRIVQVMDDDVYAELQEHLTSHPDAGPVIVGSGGVRKIRWRGSNRGKRGGSRLIYYWDNGYQILMLYVYLKKERENLTQEQVSMMREIAKEFKNEQEEL